MWEKFTPSALEIIKSATKEAKLSGHGAVDSSHLLFSLVREQQGGSLRASQVLHEFDLHPDVVYAELIAIRPENGPGEPKLKFTKDAETVLRKALSATERSPFKQIGGDQLLLGLLETGDSPAAQFLHGRGLTVETAGYKLAELALLENIDYELARSLGDDDPYVPLAKRASGKLRTAFLQGVKSALAGGGAEFAPRHLVLGALRGENEFVEILRRLDYDCDSLYRRLNQSPAQAFQTPGAEENVSLKPTEPLIELLRGMQEQQALLMDRDLTTTHLLLAILNQTQSPLHNEVVALGDINTLNHRRVRERLQRDRYFQAE